METAAKPTRPHESRDDNTIYVEGDSNYSGYDSPGGTDMGVQAASVIGDFLTGGPGGHGDDGANEGGNWEERSPLASDWRATPHRHMGPRRRAPYMYHGNVQATTPF